MSTVSNDSKAQMMSPSPPSVPAAGNLTSPSARPAASPTMWLTTSSSLLSPVVPVPARLVSSTKPPLVLPPGPGGRDASSPDSYSEMKELLTPDVAATGPYIDVYHSGNITALRGITTRLNCRVRRLGNRTVGTTLPTTTTRS